MTLCPHCGTAWAMHGCDSSPAAMDKGAEREQQAIVALLERRAAELEGRHQAFAAARLRDAADAIHRGQHLPDTSAAPAEACP